MSKVDTVIRSRCIFTGETTNTVLDGYVAIGGNTILGVGPVSEMSKYSDAAVIDVGDCTVCPGLVDNHVFFAGYIWQRIGFDAAPYETPLQCLEKIKLVAETQPQGPILGHGMDVENWSEEDKDGKLLTIAFPDRPVMVFSAERDYCWMNAAASEQFDFAPNECYAEACHKVFEYLFKDTDYVRDQYMEFQKMLAAQGVTSIKEIGFDDYAGFTDLLKELEDTYQLKHRVYLVSQPVAEPVNFEYGKACRKQFDGSFVSFMGYNMMVDGDIEGREGDILDGYPEKPQMHCAAEIDYDTLEKNVMQADSLGFRCALHAEGDRAVRRVIDILANCTMSHVIVDMELIDPTDQQRLVQHNIATTQYVQIMNCYDSFEDYYGLNTFSQQRQKTIWPYKDLLNLGVTLSFGTDLPLDIPNLADSLQYACRRRFPDGAPIGGYQMQNALTPGEVLYCWSTNGQKVNYAQDRLGSLQVGKLADLIILNCNLFGIKPESYNEVAVTHTYCDGILVYQEESLL